jgi:hypothetical protein
MFLEEKLRWKISWNCPFKALCKNTFNLQMSLYIYPPHTTPYFSVYPHTTSDLSTYSPFTTPVYSVHPPHTTSDFPLYVSHTTSNFSVYPHGINRCLCVSPRLYCHQMPPLCIPLYHHQMSLCIQLPWPRAVFVYPTHMIIPGISPTTTDVSVFLTSAIRWFQRFMLSVHKMGIQFKKPDSSSLWFVDSGLK